MWELVPELTNHAAEFRLNSVLSPTSQSLHPIAGLGVLDGFFTTYFVHSDVLNQSGQLVQMWV